MCIFLFLLCVIYSAFGGWLMLFCFFPWCHRSEFHRGEGVTEVVELKPAQFVGNLIGSANASGLTHEQFGSSPEECNP